MPDRSFVRLHRLAGSRDQLRRYKVLVDGEPVGDIRQKEDKMFSAEPGPHTLQVKIDWARSKELSFDLEAGEVISFECQAGRLWRAVTDLLTAPSSYITLRRAPEDA